MTSLLERYTYGIFVDPPAGSPEADFFLGGPARERELVALARSQLVLTQEAISAVSRAGRNTAAVFRNELERQSAELSEQLRRGSESVVSTIDNLADRVSAELGEIRWQLVQLQETSDEIREILRHPRSTQAQELVQQGVRNLNADRLEQAEDRFLRALDFDNTDYQVLMNLSSIELRKGNADKACSYLRDAFSLPPNLSSRARAEALWSLARVRYANKHYVSAAKVAHQSLQLLSNPRRRFQYGVYLILATSARQGLSTLERAIRQDSGIFAVAASSRDLTAHRREIDSLLDSLANEALSRLQSQLEGLAVQLRPLESLPLEQPELIERFRLEIAALDRVLSQPSYSDLVAACSRALDLQRALSHLEALSVAEETLRSAIEERERTNAHLALAESAYSQFSKGDFPLGSILVLSFLLGLLGLFILSRYQADTWAAGGGLLLGLPMLTSFLELLRRSRRASCRAAQQAARSAAVDAEVAAKAATSARDGELCQVSVV